RPDRCAACEQSEETPGRSQGEGHCRQSRRGGRHRRRRRRASPASRRSERLSTRGQTVMRDPFEPFLREFGVVILDGALATELERRGADLRDPLWSAKLLIEQPDVIRQVHLDYLRAGAAVVTSASYQATFAGFARRGLSAARAAELMTLSVRLAQEARAQLRRDSEQPVVRPLPLVAASVGRYGACLHDGSEYRGDYGLSAQELMDFHRPRLDALAHSGADLFACETIPCLTEAEALVRLLADYPDMPAWLSFSCRDEQSVCHGEP